MNEEWRRAFVCGCGWVGGEWETSGRESVRKSVWGLRVCVSFFPLL